MRSDGRGCAGGLTPMTTGWSSRAAREVGQTIIKRTMIERNPIDTDHVKMARVRFETKFKKSDPTDCWLWTAGTFGDGYGRFTLAGSYYQAHRIAWAVTYGEDPGDDLVLHHCDRVDCVNPHHLYLGDQVDNMQDVKARGGGEAFASLGEENPNAKLTLDEVREIRTRYGKEDVLQRDLAAEYGVSPSLISMVVNEVQWPHA